MEDAIVLPTYTDEYLASLSPFELTDLMIENEDRVPRNVIDECARRGDELTEHLNRLHEIDYLWDPEGNAGLWWLRLHAAMILGLIPSEKAGLLLVELMRRLSIEEDSDMQDWLAGYWPALFNNKPETVLAAVRALAEDRSMGWYIRVNAIEPVMASAQHHGGVVFEQVFAWLVDKVADETDDRDFRLLAAMVLLKHPRSEYRALLDGLADSQTGSGKFFDRKDVQKAYSDASRKFDRHTNPWGFYEPDSITNRQIRWRDEDAKAEMRRLNDAAEYPDSSYEPYYFEEPYVRPAPKIGRNDPCPCGSGKKYKKCCQAKE